MFIIFPFININIKINIKLNWKSTRFHLLIALFSSCSKLLQCWKNKIPTLNDVSVSHNHVIMVTISIHSSVPDLFFPILAEWRDWRGRITRGQMNVCSCGSEGNWTQGLRFICFEVELCTPKHRCSATEGSFHTSPEFTGGSCGETGLALKSWALPPSCSTS